MIDNKAFVNNFIKAFHPNAKMMFVVRNSRTRNNFFMHIIVEDLLYSVLPIKDHYHAYDRGIPIALDKVFKSANPELMLRDGVMVSLDDLVKKHKCNEDAIMAKVIIALSKAFNLKFKNETTGFIAHPRYIGQSLHIAHEPLVFLSSAQTFEEFKVAVDLKTPI